MAAEQLAKFPMMTGKAVGSDAGPMMFSFFSRVEEPRSVAKPEYKGVNACANIISHVPIIGAHIPADGRSLDDCKSGISRC